MISIVITAYNVEEYLEGAIRSALNQTYKDLEIIVVNDCSPDKCKDIVERLQKEDNRIKLINNEVNVGAGLSRRYGIKASTGEYVLLLDGDDTLEPGYIEALYNTAKEKNADIVSGGVRIIQEGKEDRILAKPLGEYSGMEAINNEFDRSTVAFLNNKIVRRSLYDIVEYCDRRFIEDTPVLMKLFYYANKVVYIPFTGYNYPQRDNSLIHSGGVMKYFIFATLFLIDVIEFFKDKEEEYRKRYSYESFEFQYGCKILNGLKDKDLEREYPKEWKIICDYKNKKKPEL